MTYGLTQLAAMRSVGKKPSFVLVEISDDMPKFNWWEYSDLSPVVVIKHGERVDADDLIPLSGLDLTVYSQIVTDHVERVLEAIKQVALGFVFVSPALEDVGFCWRRDRGEKLLGDRYAMAS